MGMPVSYGKKIEVAEAYLDGMQTLHSRGIYLHTGFVPSHHLREIAEERGGTWADLAENEENYDTLNFPFEDGTLIIERSRIRVGRTGNFCVGHAVSYVGEILPTEEKILAYLRDLLKEDRRRTREEVMIRAQRIDPRWRGYWIKEYEALFSET